MAKNKQEFKVGDLVRIRGRTLRGGCGHGVRQGAVCRVVNPCNPLGNVDVSGPSRYADRNTVQGVFPSHVKLAKQAMRKRDEYAARR